MRTAAERRRPSAARTTAGLVLAGLLGAGCAPSVGDPGQDRTAAAGDPTTARDVGASDGVAEAGSGDAPADGDQAGADAAAGTTVAPSPEPVTAAPSSTQAAASTSTAATPASGAALEALWWTVDTLDGGTLDAASLAGGNVVLWMWAPWCSVCNREAPDVARALADLPDDVTIVGVAGRDDVGAMQAFVEEHGLGAMVHVVDEDGAVWASYGVAYQPAWVFIDADGNASVAAGAIGYDGLFDGIAQVFGS